MEWASDQDNTLFYTVPDALGRPEKVSVTVGSTSPSSWHRPHALTIRGGACRCSVVRSAGLRTGRHDRQRRLLQKVAQMIDGGTLNRMHVSTLT